MAATHQDQTPPTPDRTRRRLRGALASGVACAVAIVGLWLAVAPAQAAVSLGLGPIAQLPADPDPFAAQVHRGDEYVLYSVTVRNTGGDPTSAPTNLHLSFAPGLALDQIVPLTSTGWTCYSVASTCTYSGAAVTGGASFAPLVVGVDVDPAVASDTPTSTFTAFGGGASGNAIRQHSFDIVEPARAFGLVEGSFVAGACFEAAVLTPPTTGACESAGAGDPFVQAGGHPFAGNAAFEFMTKVDRSPARWGGNPAIDRISQEPVEDLGNGAVTLPPGFVANPTVIAGGCTVQQISEATCPTRYAVGRGYVETLQRRDQQSTVFKLKSEKGYPARFALKPVIDSPVTITLRPRVRPGDSTVTVQIPNPPQFPPLYQVHYFTFCAYGAKTRLEIGLGGVAQVSDGCKQPDDAGALSVPFMTNPTRCTGQPDVTSIDVTSYQNPGSFDQDGLPDLSDPAWKTYQAEAPPLNGCGDVPFDPSVTVAVTSSAPDSAAGLSFDLDVPQEGLVDPDGIATSHLDRTVVELADGLTVNPSSATGLEGCSDEQMGLVTRSAPGPFPVQFDGQPVNCPDGSKLGTVMVTSPLVDETLHGTMYLGTPKSTDPESGDMLRLFLVIRNDEIGVMVKLEGSTTSDSETGKLVATFDNNPQLPFDHLEVKLKSGDKGVLATPRDCGTATTDTELEPWSGTGAVDRRSSFQVDGDCAERFVPVLDAGMDTKTARANGKFSFKFTRQDGEQRLRGLTARLPQGLLASVKDLPLCSNAQADAGQCPEASRIGIVDAKAGVGDPFVLERKGEVFLTEGYKGGAYGLAVKVRPIAGPFRGQWELSPIVVRQAIHVDRTSAQVTAISDPFPLIHHGVQLRVREVTVLVDREKFMLNPSDCAAKQVGADLLSDEGASHPASNLFQAAGCQDLSFKPKLALRLTGKKQITTGTHPGIRAQVDQAGIPEAGIKKAVVRLPKSLALDVNNAQALCEFVDGTKPDLENHCPKGSIVGRARATTPLLNDPLVGNVYFVKNIRKDPRTGNEIRTLPMIIVALRGEIAINLKGESDTTKSGKLVNTFNQVPDAPVSQFNLDINGGSNGILAVTRTRRAKINLCAKPNGHVAEADMDGHNGRRHDTNVRMKTLCTKRQTKNAKRAAKQPAGQR